MELSFSKIIQFLILAIVVIVIVATQFSNTSNSVISGIDSMKIKQLEVECDLGSSSCNVKNCDDEKIDCSDEEQKLWNSLKKDSEIKCDSKNENYDVKNCGALQKKVLNIVDGEISSENIDVGDKLSNTKIKEIIETSKVENLDSFINEEYINSAIRYTISKESLGKPGLVIPNDAGKGPSFGLFQFNRDGEMSEFTTYLFENNGNLKFSFPKDFRDLVTNSKGKTFSQSDLETLAKLGEASEKEQIEFKKYQMSNLLKGTVKKYIPDRYNEVLKTEKAYIAIFDINNQMGGKGLIGSLKYANEKSNEITKDILDGSIQNMKDRGIDDNIFEGKTFEEIRMARNEGVLKYS